MSDDTNIIEEVIGDLGGYQAFAKRMGVSVSSTALRDIARGERIPSEIMRRRIVRASEGRLSEADVIAASGQTEPSHTAKYGVHPMWTAPDDDLRYWIWKTAADGARKQRLLNRRRA